MGMKINNEKIETFGHKDDEKDWLPDEIMHAAEDLRKFCGDLIAFNDEFGLTERLENRLPKKQKIQEASSADNP